jgi:hypothetical protein
MVAFGKAQHHRATHNRKRPYRDEGADIFEFEEVECNLADEPPTDGEEDETAANDEEEDLRLTSLGLTPSSIAIQKSSRHIGLVGVTMIDLVTLNRPTRRKLKQEFSRKKARLDDNEPNLASVIQHALDDTVSYFNPSIDHLF